MAVGRLAIRIPGIEMRDDQEGKRENDPVNEHECLLERPSLRRTEYRREASAEQRQEASSPFVFHKIANDRPSSADQIRISL